MSEFSDTNDPSLRSWVDVPPGSDFPIQNLPFGICESAGQPGACVAIGNHVVLLARLQERGFFGELGLPDGVFSVETLNVFLSLGKQTISQVRRQVSALLRYDNPKLQTDQFRDQLIVPQSLVQLRMPLRVPNYTDFYSSKEHAFNVGSMFRDPKSALLPNWSHLPVGYHGRASSIVVTGTPIRRPRGQIKLPDVSGPVFSATRKLDFEQEIAFVTCRGNRIGEPVPIAHAEDYIAGFVLFNDWSARDIQQWEYVPLGPFLGKNFASSISSWVVVLDALEPFRVRGPEQDPPVLPYLSVDGENNFDIVVETKLRTVGGNETILSRSNTKYLYWNIRQQLAHHTINGCNVQVGDLYASGTISGPATESCGSLLELTWNGERPLKLNDGTTRTFLEDGDTVIIHAFAEKNGVRIGFGSCEGQILPASDVSYLQ